MDTSPDHSTAEQDTGDRFSATERYVKQKVAEAHIKMAKVGAMIKTQNFFDKTGRREVQQCTLIYPLVHPYLPCTKALSELQEIHIADLTPDTHHRGKFVLLQKPIPEIYFSPMETAFVAMDKCVGTTMIEMPLADQPLGSAGLFPPDTAFAVKEPYYYLKNDDDHACDGEGFIRIDHLSDMVTIHLPDARAPEYWNKIASTKLTTALKWKEKGNALLKSDDFAGAVAAYTKGILKVSESEFALRCDLYRNRAQANLRFGRFESAWKDAVHKFTGTSALDLKAVYRASCAWYECGHYEFRKVMEKSLQSMGEDHDIRKILRQIDAREHEQRTGEYDFKTILKKLSRQEPRVDAASYLKNVEVKTSGAIAGRGLFATQDIDAGDLIFCEKSRFTNYMFEQDSCVAKSLEPRNGKTLVDNLGFWRQMTNKLMHNPSLLPQILYLQSAHAGLGETVVEVDGQPVIDTFQIHDIITENKFRGFSPDKSDQTREYGFCSETGKPAEINNGIWPYASMINHSCIPNSNHIFLGDLMLVRATKPIKAGEEIVHTYRRLTDVNRMASLQLGWEIDCRCPQCKAEQQDSKDVLAQRQKLWNSGDEFVKKNLGIVMGQGGRATDRMLQQTKNSLAALNATYDRQRYSGLPRIATLYLALLLPHIHYRRGEYHETIKAAREFLFAIGFTDVGFDADNVVIGGAKNAVVTMDAVEVLRLAAMAKIKQGEQATAKAMEEEIKKIYVMLNGLENGYKNVMEKMMEGMTLR